MAIPHEYQKYEQTVSVACINFSTVWGNKEANLTKIKAFVTQAAAQGNNIIVFPELALSGYECDEEGTKQPKQCAMHKKAAETIPGPSTEEISQLTKELGVYVILGMPEQDRTDREVRYISAAVIGPEGCLGAYRKLHLLPPPLGTEVSCFKPGTELPVFETRYGPIGIQICLEFYIHPELTRILVLKGARLIFNITASPSGPGKSQFIVQQTGARATENLIYCGSANLVGKERTKSFYGHSCIAGPLFPRLNFIFAEGEEEEEIVSATLSLGKLHYWADMMPWKKLRQGKLIVNEFKRLL